MGTGSKKPDTATLPRHPGEESRRRQDTFARWVSKYEWHWILTLTFTREPSVDAARQEFGQFVRRVERCRAGRVSWVVFAERSADRRLHLHALMHSTNRILVDGVRSAWLRGWAHVLCFDPRGSGASYVTKSLGTLSEDWDISRARPPVRGSSSHRHVGNQQPDRGSRALASAVSAQSGASKRAAV